MSTMKAEYETIINKNKKLYEEEDFKKLEELANPKK
jgi:hypothetical protein